MIDSHAHLYWQSFDEDRADVIERAFADGVTKIINIATDLDTGAQCIVLAEQYDGLYATAGITGGIFIAGLYPRSHTDIPERDHHLGPAPSGKVFGYANDTLNLSQRFWGRSGCVGRRLGV